MSNITTIARPYAKAAFATALQGNAVVQWSAFLNSAKEIVSDAQMKHFLQDPCRTSAQRVECLGDLCGPAVKDGLQKTANDFLKLLAEYDRLLLLPTIAELFEGYRVEHEKLIHVQVVSAREADYPNAQEEEKLRKALQARLQRTVDFTYEIDPNLIGGLVIKAGDLVIDGSVRGKLARLNMALTA